MADEPSIEAARAAESIPAAPPTPATTQAPAPALPGPRPPADDGDPGDPGGPGDPASTERRWSTPSLAILGTAAVALVIAVAYHLGTIFLSIAPSNPISQQASAAVTAHVMPEFEQNWQLFAPNPLQNNIAVEARVQTLAPDGSRTISPWIDLTAADVAAIRGNIAPSHVNQNLLRRAWDYYTAWHDQQDDSTGFGGPLSVEYLKRIALQRIGRHWNGQPVIQIQLRSSTTSVTGPAWTGAPATTTPSYRTLGWWPANDEDYQGLGVSR
ncbi:DUF5819 family protein [Streptacidiphilus sp. MAP5-3]|uniref:DUF5819 family protein n=1 Tax=unclassified Streptacidiphilus TaxID=2643834 RepID=UPI003517CC01